MKFIKSLALTISLFGFLPVAFASDEVDRCHDLVAAKNDEEAIPFCISAAEQGNAGAQYQLGLMYHYEKGVPQDYKQAVYWYTKGAEQGNAGAQYHLGLMYHYEMGVPQDYKQAVYWYTKGAEQGHADSQFYLGSRYQYGEGAP
ncbi:MAG: tetratricopeptide repeat protein, partial [Pseudomonadales bacterium]